MGSDATGHRNELLYDTVKGSVELDRFASTAAYAAVASADKKFLFGLGGDLGFPVRPF